jgi:hypothetical protein
VRVEAAIREFLDRIWDLGFSSCPRGLVEELGTKGLADKLIFGSDCISISAWQQLGRVLFALIPRRGKKENSQPERSTSVGIE